MKVIQVYRDGKMDEITVSPTDLPVNLGNISKSQGEGPLQCVYEWPYEDTRIQCYGWYDGEAGFENKTELPPGGISSFLDNDSSVQLLYGDLFLCKLENISGSYGDLDIGEYSEFYTLSFGGFDDCDTDTDSSEVNTESEDEDYVDQGDILTDDEEIADDDIVSEGDSELEEDINEYE